MSFLDDLVDIGSSIFGGEGLGASLARTALAGYALSEITNSLRPEDAKDAAKDPTNAAAVDKGVRQQVDADTDNSVPVVYGSAFAGSKIFDAYMTPDATTMYFALAISEVTSTFSLSGESLGRVKFEAVYWNNSRVVFDIDNTTVLSLFDESSGSTVSLDGMAHASGGLIKIYLYNDGSRFSTITTDRWSPGSPYPSGTAWATNVMPHWTSAHEADKLVFAIVKVVYNKDKNVTGLGDLKFHITNPLNNPGDVLIDYMTNTRYGAGITYQDIFNA